MKWKSLLFLSVTCLCFNNLIFSNGALSSPIETIKINEAVLPTATISGTATVCRNAPQPLITFTGSDETGPYTFTYNINGGPNLTVVTTSGNSVTVAAPTNVVGVFNYNLVSVSCPTAGCSQAQTGTATITVLASPSATITGTSSCVGASSAQVTFIGSNGTAPYTFTYNIGGGASQTITTITGNSISLPVSSAVAGAFVYNLIGVSSPGTPGCTPILTSSVTINIANIPTASLSGSTSVCPGTTAPISVTGTPNATVVLYASTGAYSTVSLNAAGTATFTTPPINQETVFTINSVQTTPPGCTNQSVPGSVTISININGCASVVAGNLDLSSNVPPICNAGECRQLSAEYVDLGTTTQYAVSSIPYCPQASFTDPSFVPVSVDTDDVWSGDIPLPQGFVFCFFGQSYTSANVGSNGVVTFNSHLEGEGCPWNYNASVPSPAFPILNAIYGVYQDIDPNVTPTPPAAIHIGYKIMGVYPCRKLIVNFTNVPQFSCLNSVGLQTSQIVLYEISNIIEIYVERRVPCTGWNNGNGVIGIQNTTGSLGYTPPGRNTGSWSAFNEAWRFTPNGPSAVTFQWLAGDDFYSSDTTITVCPTETTTYTAVAQYDVCGVAPVEIKKEITVEVIEDFSQEPQDLIECENLYDLTENTPVIIGVEDPSLYEVYYHLNYADAANAANPIGNPETYVSTGSGQTIYASIINFNSPCIVVKDFQLILDDCSCPSITDPSSAQAVCLGGDPGLLGVDTEFTGTDAISFVYFTTPQTGTAMYSGGALLGSATPNGATFASYDPPILGNTGSLPNVAGTYYVYAIANPTPLEPNCRPYKEIIVVVNELPTATISGSTTICSGNTGTITFTGTPLSTVTYTIDAGANQTVVLNAAGTAIV
ncbi:MAG TPA: hypothetical protein VGB50_07640, partial [Flavobacterium sp.]